MPDDAGRWARGGPRRAVAGRGPRTEGGYVTAETAVVLPALVLFVAVLVSAVVAAGARIGCVDAAQAGARALARGEPEAIARERAASIAPRGARTEVVTTDELVRVRVSAEVAVVGRLPGGPRFHVEHTAVVALEPGVTLGSGVPAGSEAPVDAGPGVEPEVVP